MKNEIFKKPEYGHNPDGYLYHKEKMVMVQIGSTMYALKEWTEATPKNIDALLDKFDVRLLKEE